MDFWIFNIGSPASPQPQLNQLGYFVDDIVNIEANETTGVGGGEHCLFEISSDGVSWSEISDDADGDDGWSTEWNTNEFYNGEYIVRATMFDASGKTGEDRCRVYVNNGAPVVSINCSSYVPLYVFPGYDYGRAVFDASECYDEEGYIVNWTWDFGDGNFVLEGSYPYVLPQSRYGETPTHYYNLSDPSNPGIYTSVGLWVIDNDGAMSYGQCLFNLLNGTLEKEWEDTEKRLVGQEGDGFTKTTMVGQQPYEILSRHKAGVYEYYIHNSYADSDIKEVVIDTGCAASTTITMTNDRGWSSSRAVGKLTFSGKIGNSVPQCGYLHIKLTVSNDNGPGHGRITPTWRDGNTHLSAPVIVPK